MNAVAFSNRDLQTNGGFMGLEPLSLYIHIYIYTINTKRNSNNNNNIYKYIQI